MEFVKEFPLMGYYTCQNKEKTKQFYVIQVLVSWKDRSGPKSKIIPIFTDSDIYSLIAAMDIGSLVKVNHSINYDMDKVQYSVVL